MEATWEDGNRSNFSVAFLVIPAIMALLAGVMWIVTSQHALEKHGAAVITAASQCFDSHQPSLNMKRAEDGRIASVCFDGHYHVSITTSDGRPVTLFTKDKMTRIEQVIRYLCNAGYISASSPCPIE